MGLDWGALTRREGSHDNILEVAIMKDPLLIKIRGRDIVKCLSLWFFIDARCLAGTLI